MSDKIMQSLQFNAPVCFIQCIHDNIMKLMVCSIMTRYFSHIFSFPKVGISGWKTFDELILYGLSFYEHWVKALHYTVYLANHLCFCADSIVQCLAVQFHFMLLSCCYHALYICCDQPVVANIANNCSRCVFIAFPTCNWDVVLKRAVIPNSESEWKA